MGMQRFNPTLVRLRPDTARWPPGAPDSFNPTLVRLRPAASPDQKREYIAFQSHAGSIEAVVSVQWRQTKDGVSIPRWFD